MGIVRTETSDVPLDLYGLRTGGIGDIGSFAELSYDLIPSKEFADYSRKRTVMLIDPSGECEFDTGSNSNVRCSNRTLPEERPFSETYSGMQTAAEAMSSRSPIMTALP